MREQKISDLFEETFSRLVVAAAIGINITSIARHAGVSHSKIHKALGFFRGTHPVMHNNIDPSAYARRFTDRELMLIQRSLGQVALTLSANAGEQIKTAARIIEQEKQIGTNLRKARKAIG